MLKNRFMPHCYSADDELQVMGSPHQQGIGPLVRCLVWNIYKARRSNWQSDFCNLKADRDLVLLQEAVFNAPSDPLFTQCQRFEWTMARSFKDPRTQIVHGVKTGSSVRSLENRFYLSPHTEPVSQTQKLLLTTLYPIAGRDELLMVLNMHAINFVGARKYEGQLEQLSGALKSHDGPLILGGDFNTWSPKRLASFLKVVTAAELQEAVMQRNKKLTHMNRELDHLYYRGLRLQSVESLHRYRSSDHSPITATFEL